jgi:hypothetical protein
VSSGFPRAGRRWQALVLAAAGLSFLLLLPGVRGAMVADDWPVFEAVSHASSADFWRWLDPRGTDWFRPVSLAYAWAGWHVFGLAAVPYRLVGLTLFGLTAVGLGLLAANVSGDLRAAPLAALLLAAGATHSEPVLWISAHNELLAGFFVVGCLLAYTRYLRRGRRPWLAVALASAALALGSKETAYGLPLGMLALELWLPGPRRAAGPAGRAASSAAYRGLRRPSMWVGAACLVLVAARAGAGRPYAVSLSAVQLLRNMTYTLAMILVALPADARELALPGGTADLAVVILGGLALAGIAGLALRWRAWRGCSVCMRAVSIAGLLTLAGLLPASPVVSERTAYLASLGAALALGLLLARLSRLASVHRMGPGVATLLVVLYVAATSLTVRTRAGNWTRAGRAVEAVMTDMTRVAALSPTDARLEVLGLPDRVGAAYAFRNAFPAAGLLWPVPRPVTVILASESAVPSGPGELPAVVPRQADAVGAARSAEVAEVVLLRYVELPQPALVPAGAATR